MIGVGENEYKKIGHLKERVLNPSIAEINEKTDLTVSYITEKIESRNVRGIARKIRDYVSFLEENDSYETVIKKIGDGIAVTRRK